MHNFYLNNALAMRNHWRANFFKWESKGQGTAKTHFGNSNEDYGIPIKTWDIIDKDMKEFKLPTCFGDRMRGVYEFRKANEWKTWVHVSWHVH